MGPTPHPGPAVHRYGWTALHWAADYGNRRMIGSLVDADADVNAQDDFGCAVSAAAIGGVRRPSRRRRRPCRMTPLHCGKGHSASVAELLLRGADGAVQTKIG